MRHIMRSSIVTGIAVAGLQLTSFQTSSFAASENEEPAHVELVEGSYLKRITLTEKAIERLDLKTAKVSKMPLTTQVAGTESVGVSTTERTVVPYAALLYDEKGNAWVYISPEPRSFVRHRVIVDRIEGDSVYLTDGPPVDTVVATYGAAELYGAESGIGH